MSWRICILFGCALLAAACTPGSGPLEAAGAVDFDREAGEPAREATAPADAELAVSSIQAGSSSSAAITALSPWPLVWPEADCDLIGTNTGPERIAFIDVDLDGTKEILVSHRTRGLRSMYSDPVGAVRRFQRMGNGWGSALTGARWFQFETVELDGDEAPELAFWSSGSFEAPLRGARHDTQGAFTISAPYQPVADARTMDLNGDGRTDFVTWDKRWSGPVRMWLSARVGWQEVMLPRGSNDWKDVTASDVVGDRRPRLVSIVAGRLEAWSLEHGEWHGPARISGPGWTRLFGNIQGPNGKSLLLGAGAGDLRLLASANGEPAVLHIGAAVSAGATEGSLVAVVSEQARLLVIAEVVDGVLVERRRIRVGHRPTAVAIGDTDGDGQREVVVADAALDRLFVVSAENGPARATCGVPSFDLALPAELSVQPKLLLLSAADAGFNWSGGFTSQWPAGSSLTAGDFNGDGRPDLARHDDSGLTVHWGRTDGGLDAQAFGPVRVPSAGDGGELQLPGLVSWDSDGDGKDELLMAGAVNDLNEKWLLSALLSPASTAVSPRVLLRYSDWSIHSPRPVEAAGGGQLSLFFTTIYDSRSGGHLLGATDAGTAAVEDRCDNGDIMVYDKGPASFGDLNGDGIPERLFQSVGVTIHDPAHQMRECQMLSSRGYGVVRDATGDGLRDVIWVESDGSLRVSLGNGNGGITESVPLSGPREPTQWSLMDVDGDRREDAVGLTAAGIFIVPADESKGPFIVTTGHRAIGAWTGFGRSMPLVYATVDGAWTLPPLKTLEPANGP